MMEFILRLAKYIPRRWTIVVDRKWYPSTRHNGIDCQGHWEQISATSTYRVCGIIIKSHSFNGPCSHSMAYNFALQEIPLRQFIKRCYPPISVKFRDR